MLMYINPTLQFVTAIWLFGEPMQSRAAVQLRADLAGAAGFQLERLAQVPASGGSRGR
jgi:EamA domain-containing membrane protein RarD